MQFLKKHIELILAVLGLVIGTVDLLSSDEFKAIGNFIKGLTITDWLLLLILVVLSVLTVSSLSNKRNE
jgi:hypothetical protein